MTAERARRHAASRLWRHDDWRGTVLAATVRLRHTCVARVRNCLRGTVVVDALSRQRNSRGDDRYADPSSRLGCSTRDST